MRFRICDRLPGTSAGAFTGFRRLVICILADLPLIPAVAIGPYSLNLQTGDSTELPNFLRVAGLTGSFASNASRSRLPLRPSPKSRGVLPVARLRIGVVGAGPVAERYHMPAIRGVPEVRATTVVDSDADRARHFADRYSFPRWTTQLEELVGTVDVIVVALPNDLHASVSCELL